MSSHLVLRSWLPDLRIYLIPSAITRHVHLIRNTFRLTSRADSDAIKRDINRSTPHPMPMPQLAALNSLEKNGEPNVGR